ncbi:YczE/YyaS/YitT family protein [Cytobacillus firmus]|uniref:YczE/YyaS/YitT family protein n=1 Tax=Cytobacillus firmus TaxID=1399 RepID=UPI001C94D565|nr:YitT family protein [Cytobacillus firmus]MBY6052668.1 YitT family protein [Cytobacillus firmus]URT72865.1 YitT family protein [Cytobacillus firmus]
MKERLLFFIIGMLILTMGVALIIRSNLGASAWDALAVGESQMFNLTVGTFVFINGIVLIFINAFLMKKKPEVLAAISILIIGALIDFWLLIIFGDLSPQTLAMQSIILFVGILLMGMGVAIYLQAKFPASPMDTLMVAIHTRFGLNLRNSRIISESFALLLAFLFRGAIGVGTIVVTLTLGLVVQFFYPVFERALGKMQAPKGPVITK